MTNFERSRVDFDNIKNLFRFYVMQYVRSTLEMLSHSLSAWTYFWILNGIVWNGKFLLEKSQWKCRIVLEGNYKTWDNHMWR